MKHLTKITIILFMIVGIISCELPDNADPKNPRQVTPESVFANAQRQLGDYVSTMDYNINISRFFVQYWTEVTYTDEVKYDFANRQIPDNLWNVFYQNVLMDFKESKKIINNTDYLESEYDMRDNRLAIADIMQVYAWHILVDAFGDIPYSEALNPDNATPAYDDAETIYKDLISRLSNDLDMLTMGASSWGEADLFYSGDVQHWKLFAASLKFRLAMRMADSNPSYSQEMADEALSTGVITSQDQAAVFEYTKMAPHVHSIYEWFVLDGRTDVVPTQSFVGTLDSLNDPRLNNLVSKVDTTGDGVGDYYNPQPYGIGVSVYSAVSHFTPQFYEPDFRHVFIDYVEMEFLKAEAAERGGYDVSGSAMEHYNNAITASIQHWGGTESEASNYLAQEDVNYATADGNWKKKIGTQKWIALYNRGNEAWSSWRVLDYPQTWNDTDDPTFIKPEGAKYDYVPVRYPYPFNEYELNGSNYNAATEEMGGDNPGIHVFWDVN